MTEAATTTTAIKAETTVDSTSDTVSDPSTVHEQQAQQLTFKKWKRLCAQMINALRDEQCDITDYLRWYEKMLTDYLNNKPIIPNLTDTDEVREFFLNRFLDESVTAMMKREHIHWLKNYNMADLIANCCKLLVRIAVPLIKDDDPLSYTIIYYCMNAGTAFFRTFGLDWREKRGYEVSKEEEEELSEWRDAEVVEGAYVDYLFTNRWKYGQIKKISNHKDPETGVESYRLNIQPQMPGIWPTHIRVGGAQNQQEQEFTEIFTLNEQTMRQIAKPLTKSVEHIPHMVEWRKHLTADEEADEKYRKCDVLDTVRKWYTCIILDENHGANTVHVRFDGWSQRYDEWIGREDKRIQPHLTHATGGRKTQGVQGDIDDLKGWEDDEDPEDCFAVYRGKLNEHSYHLVDVLNEFGRCGGFDALIVRLTTREPNMPVRNLRFIISPLSKCYQLYSKKVAADIIPKIHKLTFETLESLSEEELRDLRKDYLERIVNSVEGFLRRFEIADDPQYHQSRSANQTLRQAQAALDQLNDGIKNSSIWSYAEMLNFDPDVFSSLPEDIQNDIIPTDLQQEVKRELNTYKALVAQRDLQQQQLQQIQQEQEEVPVPDDDAKTEIKEDDDGTYTAGLQTHEIHEMLETFQLRMAIRRLKCETIERRVDAVQFIDDICSRTRRQGRHYYGQHHVRFITPDYLMKWIEDNKLLELLFGEESHPEVTEHSANILQFMCRESGLTQHHLESIWTSLKRAATKQIEGENESRILCELIENLRSLLQSENIDFLFSKFDEMDPSTLTKYHLKLMSALSKNETTMQGLDIPQTVLRALWDPVGDNNEPEEKQKMDDDHDSSGTSNKKEKVPTSTSVTEEQNDDKTQLNLVDAVNANESNENLSSEVADIPHDAVQETSILPNVATEAAVDTTNTSNMSADDTIHNVSAVGIQSSLHRRKSENVATKKVMKQFSQTTTLTELFWDGHCRSDLGHYQHIPSEIRAQIMEYCDFYVLRVGYKIGNPDPFTNDNMVDYHDRKWKVSILRFNEDMTTSSFAGYLESNMYYGYHPPSDQDALLWSTGKRVDCLVIRSAKVSRASDSAYGKLIDLRNQESKREEKKKQENVIFYDEDSEEEEEEEEEDEDESDSY